uniref:Uncharacterized protein n=1 Tax=Clytia hemisphaerica TaxID=252671 RepID=A0A7M5WSK3_9CNID
PTSRTHAEMMNDIKRTSDIEDFDMTDINDSELRDLSPVLTNTNKNRDLSPVLTNTNKIRRHLLSELPFPQGKPYKENETASTSNQNETASTSNQNQNASTSNHNQNASTSNHNQNASTSNHNKKASTSNHNENASTSKHNVTTKGSYRIPKRSNETTKNEDRIQSLIDQNIGRFKHQQTNNKTTPKLREPNNVAEHFKLTKQTLYHSTNLSKLLKVQSKNKIPGGLTIQVKTKENLSNNH